MPNTKRYSYFLLLAATGFIFASRTNAQLSVLANGNVGIGTAAPLQKLDVVVNAADPAQESGRFANNSVTALTKYGIRNTVSNAGAGGRYGIYSDVQQLSTSASTSYGLYNTLTAGTGGGYGIYNVNNPGGGGFRYGMYNIVNQTANTTLGIYNFTTTSTGLSYGIFNYNSISGAPGNTNYGQYNVQYSGGTGTHYGIYNYITANTATTAGTRYGIWTEVNNTGTGIRYGIYSRALGPANFAGYFDGNLFYTGALTGTSDDKLKTNVSEVTDALAILRQLHPKKYDFRSDINGMRFPEGKQIGLMASDVERVLPELVREVKTPLNNAGDSRNIKPEEMQAKMQNGNEPALVKEGEESYYNFKSVNYIGLIPVLVQAVKEQQLQIEQLRRQLQEQKAVITRLQPAPGR